MLESTTERPGRLAARSPGRRAAEFAALRALVRRETVRLVASPAQAGLTLLNPLLYFVVLGTGLSGMVGSASGGGDYMAYVYPGILMMAVQMPALNAGMSIVRDRETGLLRAVLVAPVRRDTFLVGKCLGSTVTATAQGGLLLAFAGLAGLPYDPLLLLALLGELALVAFTLTALVTLAAVRITRIETFQSALGVTMLPLFFLSGAMFSTDGLPVWLAATTLVNPLTYAVDALRQTVAGAVPGGALPTGPDWGGWTPPLAVELLVMARQFGGGDQAVLDRAGQHVGLRRCGPADLGVLDPGPLDVHVHGVHGHAHAAGHRRLGHGLEPPQQRRPLLLGQPGRHRAAVRDQNARRGRRHVGAVRRGGPYGVQQMGLALVLGDEPVDARVQYVQHQRLVGELGEDDQPPALRGEFGDVRQHQPAVEAEVRDQHVHRAGAQVRRGLAGVSDTDARLLGQPGPDAVDHHRVVVDDADVERDTGRRHRDSSHNRFSFSSNSTDVPADRTARGTASADASATTPTVTSPAVTTTVTRAVFRADARARIGPSVSRRRTATGRSGSSA
nr:ABC transporter permease [Streptomyces sp. FXJ7.023]